MLDKDGNKVFFDPSEITRYMLSKLRPLAVGFDEGKCWVCQKVNLKKGKKQCHHVLGKKWDIELQTVLCPGCHQLVEWLSHRTFLPDPHKVADLITLARFKAQLPDMRTIVKYEES